MSPPYKLTYFNVTNLGEPIRLLLSYGNLEFEDVRINQNNWPAIKENTPFGQLPTLEFDGKVMYQSLAICRYLANKVGLLGKDPWENYQIDAAVDTVNDIRMRVALYHYTQDEKQKETFRKQVFDEFLPSHMKKLDAQAKANKGYLAASRLTWADIFFVGVLDHMNFMAKQDITSIFPNLQAVKKHVLEVPNIKAWVDKRPKEGL